MPIKIDKKIVAYSIVNTENELSKSKSSSTPSVQHMHESVARPETLAGGTYKVKTPLSDHALYITINDIVLNPGTEYEVRRPFEIFINSKAMEHFQWIVALTRIISAVFRKGGDVTFLVEEMRSVFDPKGGYFKRGGRYMPSLVAEIGDVIESHMRSIGLLKEEVLDEYQRNMIIEQRNKYESGRAIEIQDDSMDSFPPGTTLCSKCHTKAVIVMDGCLTCLNCSDSKCS